MVTWTSAAAGDGGRQQDSIATMERFPKLADR